MCHRLWMRSWSSQAGTHPHRIVGGPGKQGGDHGWGVIRLSGGPNLVKGLQFPWPLWRSDVFVQRDRKG